MKYKALETRLDVSLKVLYIQKSSSEARSFKVPKTRILDASENAIYPGHGTLLKIQYC